MDNGAHDLSRVMFTTTADEDELLYLDDAIFNETMTIEESEQEYKVLKEREKQGLEEVPAGAKKANKHYRPWEDNADTTSPTQPAMDVTINDVPAKPDMRYLQVFDLFMEEAGLTEKALQIEGVRHNSLLSILSVGSYKLIPKAQMIAIVSHRMPEFSKEQDCQKLISDFYKNNDPNAALTKRQREILSEVFGESNDEETSETGEAAETSSKHRRKLIAKLLPSGLREPVLAAPKEMQMNILCAIMPIAAAYADQVEVMYADEKKQYLGLMSIIVARQAGGKSGCKEAVECWMKILKDESDAYRRQEDEIKQHNKCRKANERAQEMPQLPIRKLPITVSNSTLLKRFKGAPGHCLYSFCEELDTLLKTNSAGNWSAKYDIYRYSFDRAEWGQDYNSDQAESGDVQVIYNWTIFGTYGSFNKCFQRDNAENGLGGRVLISELPDTRFAKMPKYRPLSDEEQEAIQQAARRLSELKGYVDTPRLRKAIGKWVEEKRILALKNNDEVMDNFRRRAAVIGFRCAVVFYLLSGEERESKACVDFMLMMADYCLDTQMRMLGNMIESQQAQNAPAEVRTISDKTTFDKLPKEFTYADVKDAKGPGYSDSSYRSSVSRWKKFELIEEIGVGANKKFRKKIA
ncbi:MAG: VirE protein [Bacteroidales bacterium]|nr:VirE protein [Bacteroidales bacterium]